MGCYDFFVGTCPACGTEELSIQTKLTGESFKKFRPGDAVSLDNMKLRLKERCHKCNESVIAVVRGGVIRKYIYGKKKATVREGLFGVLLGKGDTRKKQWNRIDKDVDSK